MYKKQATNLPVLTKIFGDIEQKCNFSLTNGQAECIIKARIKKIAHFCSVLHDIIMYQQKTLLLQKVGVFMTNTQVVANTFLYSAFQENVEVSPMKLQKLMYFFFREYARTSGVKLFSEQFETWTYGSVLPSIYYEFQGYGKRKIEKFAKDAQGQVKILDFDNNDTLKTSFYKI